MLTGFQVAAFDDMGSWIGLLAHFDTCFYTIMEWQTKGSLTCCNSSNTSSNVDWTMNEHLEQSCDVLEATLLELWGKYKTLGKFSQPHSTVCGNENVY